MESVDVLIIGAGLSGIGAARHLQQQCPDHTFLILEGRGSIGGTWDLFRYPGVRSDSDMYTLGYRFRPWENPKAIADGPSIKAYIEDTARTYGIDQAIRFHHRVVQAEWSSDDAQWTVTVQVGAEQVPAQFRCRFLYTCTGYYDYAAGYTPDWPNRAAYQGRVVHPQYWPDDLRYADKRVLVIGSGATAVTLVPAMTEGPHAAAHVTMLQRSPSYVATLPSEDRIANRLRRWLPSRVAYALTRGKNIARSLFYYQIARRRPVVFKQSLRAQARAALGPEFPVDVHFAPHYAPWDERLCIIPDGDLFRALRSGKAEIVTDTIDAFTATGVRLHSGAMIDADLIVTATGLSVRILAGIELIVDGVPVDLASTMAYKGMMYSGIPNLASAFGYTNASWTLKCDLVADHFCRILRHMRRHGYVECRPIRDPSVKPRPVFDLTSGYVQRALSMLPSQGDRAPWRLYQNYVRDLWMLRFGRVAETALRFRPRRVAGSGLSHRTL